MVDPQRALEEGTWFKLICGASYQDLPRVTSLASIYTLAGADCIDVSANNAVVTAAIEVKKIVIMFTDLLLHICICFCCFFCLALYSFSSFHHLQ